MKVLFVCRSNGARSQMAEAFFHRYVGTAKSAGIDVLKTLHLGASPGLKTIEIMRDNFKIDISKKKRRQVTRKMLQDADRIVILVTPLERKILPAYFKTFKTKIIFWNVRDMRTVNANAPLIKRAQRIRHLVQTLAEK